MMIKAMTIHGKHGDIEITRTFSGALVVNDHEILCEIDRSDTREVRFAKSLNAARFVYGASKTREADATNSMLAAFCDEIDRVAGC